MHSNPLKYTENTLKYIETHDATVVQDPVRRAEIEAGIESVVNALEGIYPDFTLISPGFIHVLPECVGRGRRVT